MSQPAPLVAARNTTGGPDCCGGPRHRREVCTKEQMGTADIWRAELRHATPILNHLKSHHGWMMVDGLCLKHLDNNQVVSLACATTQFFIACLWDPRFMAI